MKRVATKQNISVARFCGEAGYGKGLIDTTSFLDCKQCIQHAIMTGLMVGHSIKNGHLFGGTLQ